MSKHEQHNRRQFLKITGGVILTTAVVGSGLVILGTRQPAVDFPEPTYKGEQTMQKRMLVAYASKCGSTAGVAEAIGKTLHDRGVTVDVRQAKHVTDVSPYQVVIVGSAIRMGKWLADARKFVQTHQQALRSIPTAYFSVCLALETDTPEKQQEALAYMDPISAIVKPVSVAAFGGKMAYDTLSFIDRLIITKMIKAPEGDHRDWERIRAWAESLG